MSHRTRNLLACGSALVALGAGATPALATATSTTGRTPAAQDVLALQPKLHNTVGRMGTAAQARKTRAALLANEKAARHAALVVSHAHASPTQLKGRAAWVKGFRDEATAAREYAYAAKLVLEGHRAAANEKDNEAYTPLMAGDHFITVGDKLMGLDEALSKIENG